ncbi:MAG: hypothetical protein QME79_10370 [Bacillota bacterium]|nr:hypothetical protein [Bacillota bacterium]
MSRSIVHRFLLASAVLLCLAFPATPAAAAPETPEVRRGHGVLAFTAFTQSGEVFPEPSLEFGPAVEYGLTDRAAVRAFWHEQRYNDPRSRDSRLADLGLKYEVTPDLAVEGFVESNWDDRNSATVYGFGLFAGKQFGRAYGSVRWQALALPYLGEYYWYDQLAATGSYALTPQLNFLGGVTATLDVGIDWRGSYGLEWQPDSNWAICVSRFTDRRDLTQLGVEYRF